MLDGVAQRLLSDPEEGDRDILVYSYDNSLVQFFTNDGAGGFDPVDTALNSLWKVTGATPADVDGDHHVDIVATSGDLGQVVWALAICQ